MKKLTPATDTLRELPAREMSEKELLWEKNHAKISSAIVDHLFEQSTMPPKSLIADITGLSRETVYKHMRTLTETPAQHDQADSFGLIAEHVLAQVPKAAPAGDLSAAKTFLNTAKTFRQSGSEKAAGKQNNYIQINKTIINQQVIQQLKPEQLNGIERTIARELDEKNMVDNG